MKRLMLLALPLLLAGIPAQAKTKPADLKWMDGPPGLPSGAQFAVMSGDPGKAGNFTIRIKMPAGYAVPAHHHPSDEHVSVLSGQLAYGMSNKLDRDHARVLSAGHQLVMKAGMNHWVFANAPVTVQVSAKGPFKIVYADPKEDPRATK
ncbi:MAG: cupin domain-containing protein [Sphingomicrobium sp.]|jgi:quercetin dioxygenase-like cupin family protein